MNISKKEIFLVAFVAVLGVLYICYFTDWFKAKYIRIEHSARPAREAWSAGGRRLDPTGKQVDNVTFSLHKDYALTSVEVVLRADALTNKYPHALWKLVSEGSPPINSFSYGTLIPGMRTSTPGIMAEPLEAGVDYRLLVKAGSLKGTNDFNIPAQAASR